MKIPAPYEISGGSVPSITVHALKWPKPAKKKSTPAKKKRVS